MTGPVVMGGDTSLANRCLDFCQVLHSQGKDFTFTLTLASSFTFSMDTKERAPTAPNKAQKKIRPSTLRRNKRRKEQFQKKKLLSSAVPGDTKTPPDKIAVKTVPEKEATSESVKLDEPPLDLSKKRSDTTEKDLEIENLKKQVIIKNSEVDQIKAVNRTNVDKMKKIIIDVHPFLPPKKKTSWIGLVNWAKT